MMKKVLCVCVGNISRSPMMQSVLQQLLGADFLVEGAGLRKGLAGRPANYRSVACMLETLGHGVRTAHDAADAPEDVAEFLPDFAFLDIGLPGMSGYELARRLRASPWTAGTILVAVTGWGQQRDRHRAQDAGFDHHLVKPVKFESILSVLETLAPAQSPAGRSG